MSRRPLISFVVVGYNQEAFIRDSVRSALAQTYEPMEIILSDDCSSDRTLEIMKQEARDYAGPHRIIVNSSSVNRGLVENLNSVWSISRGELLVVQGGDDMSVADRAEVVVSEWLCRGGVPDLVYHAVSHVDESGRLVLEKSGCPARGAPADLMESIRAGRCTAHGSACAYTRRLHERFGPLDPAVRTEDQVYPFLALLGGGVHYIDAVLLKYRIHDESLSHRLGLPRYRRRSLDQRVLAAKNNVAVAREWSRALEIANWPDPVARRELARLLMYRELNLKGYQVSRLGAIPLLCTGVRALLRPRWLAALAARHLFSIETLHA